MLRVNDHTTQKTNAEHTYELITIQQTLTNQENVHKVSENIASLFRLRQLRTCLDTHV